MVTPIQFPGKVVKRFVFLLVTKDDKCSYGFADAPTVEQALALFTRQEPLDNLANISRILWVETDEMESIDDPQTFIASAVTNMFRGNDG